MYSLSEENRQGVVARVTWSGEARPQASYSYTRIGGASRVVVDEFGADGFRLAGLSAALSRPWYPAQWRAYAALREWQLRSGSRGSLVKRLGRLHRLRPHHIGKAIVSIRRSLRIVSEKSTNPYD